MKSPEDQPMRAVRPGEKAPTSPLIPPLPPIDEPEKISRRGFLKKGVKVLTGGAFVAGLGLGVKEILSNQEHPRVKPSSKPIDTPSSTPPTETINPSVYEKQQAVLFDNITEINRLGRSGVDSILDRHPIDTRGIGDKWNIEYYYKNKIVPLTRYNSQQIPKVEAKPFLFSNYLDEQGSGAVLTSGILVGVRTIPVKESGGTATIGDLYLEIPQSAEFAKAEYQQLLVSVNLSLSGDLGGIPPTVLAFDPNQQNPVKLSQSASNGDYILTTQSGGYTWVNNAQYRQYLENNIGHVVGVSISNGAEKTPVEYGSLFNDSWLIQASVALYNFDVKGYDDIIRNIMTKGWVTIPTDVKQLSDLPDLSHGVEIFNDLPSYGVLYVIQNSQKLLNPSKK